MSGTGPQLGGLQPTPQPSGLLSPIAQLGLALGNIPAIRANAQMQQQQQQLNALAITQQKAKVGQQLYGQIADSLADPTKANDPVLLKRAMDISKQTGLPAPVKTDEHGNTVLDIDMLRPQPSWDNLPLAQRIELGQKLISTPKDQRAALAGNIKNIPQEILGAEQYIPPSDGAKTARQTALTKSVDDVSSGKLDPTRFAAMIRANAPMDKAMGIDTSGYLAPEFLQASLSNFAQAQTDWMTQKGIHLKNEDQIRSKMADNQKAETMARLQLQGAQLQQHIKEFDAKQRQAWQVHEDNIAIAGRRLDDTERGLDSLIGNRSFMQNIQTVNALSKPLGDLRAQYTAAQSQLDTTGRAIGNLAAQGLPVPDSLQKQYDDLEKHVGELGPKLNYYGTLIQNASGAAQGGISGSRVVPVRRPSQPPAPATTKFTVGQTYTDKNGNKAKYGADGSWTPVK